MFPTSGSGPVILAGLGQALRVGTLRESVAGMLVSLPDSAAKSRAVLLAEIGPAPELTLVRGPGNMGDELILAGARSLLDGHVYREIGLDALEGAEGDTALLIGSGAWSRAYHEWAPAVLGVLERRFDRVVVLPSSFEPAEDRVRAALVASRATVFAREEISYRRIAGLCRARLAHDCAFYFDFDLYRRRGEGTLNAFRTDLEAAGAEIPRDNRDLSTTCETLHHWLTAIADHAVVRTDRAHVLIAAAMMGKRVEYASSSYFKVDALAATLPADADVRRIERRTGASSSAADPSPADARQRILAATPERPAPPVAKRDGGFRVCAVILSRERGHHLGRAVRSAIESGPGVRAIVLDANSGPATRGALESLAEIRAWRYAWAIATSAAPAVDSWRRAWSRTSWCCSSTTMPSWLPAHSGCWLPSSTHTRRSRQSPRS